MFSLFLFSSNSNFDCWSVLLFHPYITHPFPLPHISPPFSSSGRTPPPFVHQGCPFFIPVFLSLSLSVIRTLPCPIEIHSLKVQVPSFPFLQAESLRLTCPLREEPYTLHRPKGDPHSHTSMEIEKSCGQVRRHRFVVQLKNSHVSV